MTWLSRLGSAVVVALIACGTANAAITVPQAIAAHERLAAQFAAQNQLDLAMIEYDAARNLCTQALNQAYKAAMPTGMRNPAYQREQAAIARRMSDALKRPNLGAKEKQRVLADYDRQLRALNAKYHVPPGGAASPNSPAGRQITQLRLVSTRLSEETANLLQRQGQLARAAQMRTLAAMERVSVFRMQNNTAAAMAELRRLAAMQPNDPEPHAQMSDLLAAQHKTDAAIAEIRTAIRLAAKPDAFGSWGTVTPASRLQREQMAKRQQGWYYRRLGTLLQQAKRLGEAEAAYKQASKLDPDGPAPPSLIKVASPRAPKPPRRR